MHMSFKGRAKQAGFTLIELIVVIVILGIMAATALPKFMDMGADARVAKMQAAQAAVKTAMATGHASWLAKGGSLATTSVAVEGGNMTLDGGYPDVSSIVADAGLTGDYYVLQAADAGYDANAKTVQIASDGDHLACAITYTEATVTPAAGATPAFVDGADIAKVNAAPSAANCK